MGHRKRVSTPVTRRLRWLVGFLVSVVLVVFLTASPTQAQETPVPTDADAQDTPAEATPESQQTPTGVPEPALRIEIVADEEPVPSGDRFDARIVVDNVEHLSAFDFVLQYDPDRIRPIEAQGADDATPSADPIAAENTNIQGELGEFLQTSPRGESATCQGPYTISEQRGNVLALCAALAPPLCLGGPEGSTGSGVLGTVTFESRGGEMTTLRVVSSNLVSDDAAAPCDPEEELRPVPIPHTTSDATVLLAGGGGISTLLLVVIVVVVVAVVLGGGGAGYYWYQRRGTGDS